MRIGPRDTVIGNEHYGWWLVGPRNLNIWTGQRDVVENQDDYPESWAVYRKPPKGEGKEYPRWHFLEEFDTDEYYDEAESEAMAFACAEMSALMDKPSPAT